MAARSPAPRPVPRPPAADVAVAGAAAALLSGAPSTIHALARGRDPLEASLAAGSLILPHETRRMPLLAAGAVAHVAISAWWASVLALLLPRRRGYAAATAAGLAIAALDLGVAGRRFPRIRALPVLPQVFDHLAFAWIVTLVLRRRPG